MVTRTLPSGTCLQRQQVGHVSLAGSVPMRGCSSTALHKRREIRYICEIIFGQRRDIRYYQITTDPATMPEESTWFAMTNLAQAPLQEVAKIYGMQMWIEYGFKQSKQELGWADFRVTSYAEIERWWEMVSSAYLMVSLQADMLTRAQPSVVVQSDMQ